MLSYKRKLILTKKQEERISSWIGACRVVYNMGLEIRISAWKNQQKSVSKYDLMKQLPDIKDIDWIKDVPSQSLQSTIDRLDTSYKNFFRNCHKGGGFPKFASKRKYTSILIKEVKVLMNNKISIPKIGELKMFKDAPILGIPKTVTIKKEPTGYFICIVCDGVSKTTQNPNESQVVGIDMGVVHFCADSHDNFIANPRIFKQYEERLADEQRNLSGKVRFSNRWKKQAKKIARLNLKIANVRKDFLHKESTKLAMRYNTVFIEDLKIVNMTKRAKPKQDEEGKFLPNGQAAKSGLNKSILDCGWGMFRDMVSYKTNVFRVPPKDTSITCRKCGNKDAENRVSQSVFSCTCCGHTENADTHAAKYIECRGTALKEAQKLKLCA